MRGLLSLCLIAISTSSAQSVRIVDGTPANFVDVQQAIAAAADGDTILVRPGVVSPPGSGIGVTGRSLDFIADGSISLNVDLDPACIPFSPLVSTGICITDLLPGQRVRFKGFDFVSANQPLLIANCQGAVIFEDCSFRAGTWLGLFDACARVTSSSAVSFIRCTFSHSSLGRPRPGLLIEGSQVALFNCMVQGGTAGPPDITASFGPGGPGIETTGSLVVISGGVVTGGFGSDEDVINNFCAFDGGAGLLLRGPLNAVEVIGASIVGGPAGPSSMSLPQCPPPAVGPQFSYLAGASPAEVTVDPTTPGFIQSPTVVTELGLANLQVSGMANSLVILGASLGQGFNWVPSSSGVLLVDPVATAEIVVGVLGPTGSLSLPIIAPPLPPSIQAGWITLQPGFLAGAFSPSGPSFSLGAPSIFSWVAAGL